MNITLTVGTQMVIRTSVMNSKKTVDANLNRFTVQNRLVSFRRQNTFFLQRSILDNVFFIYQTNTISNPANVMVNLKEKAN